MMSTWQKLFILALVSAVLMAACNRGGAPTSEAESVPVVVDDFNVIAEGRLVPLQHVQLSFSSGGLVAEVLVAEGDDVEAGQVLARLEHEEQLRSEVASAKLAVEQAAVELISARQALDDLNEKAAVVAAEAQQAVARAQEQLDDAQHDLHYLYNPDLEYYQDQVNDAQDALQIAQQNQELTGIGAGQPGSAVYQARERLKDAEDILTRVRTAIDNCVPFDDPEGFFDEPCDPNRQVRVDWVPWTLKDAQDLYDDALNALRQVEIGFDQADVSNTNAIENAQDDLDDAVQDLAWAQRAPDPIDVALREADVAVAEETLADAQRHWEAVKDGPDPDELAKAQARIERAEAQMANAQAALEAAQAALDDIELRAPWAGAVADLDLKVGQQVSPGIAVLTLADFSGWIVETDNLTEIEVPDVTVGQAVAVTPDALPDLELAGVVESISNLFEEKRGDITYTVDIRLKETDPRLRWGMTVVTTFDRP